MNKTIEIIRGYATDTQSLLDTAMMLNGPWGSGKTYFVKKKLIPALGKEKCAYISLNGVSSTAEINTRVLSSFFRIGEKAGKPTMQALGDIDFGTIGNSVRDVGFAFAGLIRDSYANYKTKNRLLIVDDLERVANELSIEEVFGFFNSYFIEKHGQKVLFVCNENEIKNQEDYQKIKEKTISWTIEYAPEFEDCFNSIIEKGNLEHHNQFIENEEENKSLILGLFKAAKINNLRTVIKVIETFNRIMGDKDESIDNDIALRLYRMIAMLINETSSGQGLINSADTINYMVKCNISMRALDLTPGGDPDVGKYLIALNGKYFKGNESRWLYLKSVHNYIADHYYDKAGILEEIKNLKTPAIEAYSRFDNIYSLETEEEVQQAIIGLKDHILNHGYSPSTLYRIFCNLQDRGLEVLDQTSIKSIEGCVLDQFEKLVDAHTDSIELQTMYNSLGATKLIGKFAKRIQPIYDAKLLQLEKSGVKQLLEAPDISSYPLVITIMSGRFFTQIITYNYAACVYNMSVSNLLDFGIALSRVGALYVSQPVIIQKEIDSIKTLIDGFKKHLDDKKWKRQMQEKFIADLENYWKYLEGSINNQE